MSDTLFDPSPYGEGRPSRTVKAPSEETAANAGEWFLVLRKGKEPHALAHRLDYKITVQTVRGKRTTVAWRNGMTWEGGWRTKCGLLGATLPLPETTVRICTKCEDT